MRYDAFISYRHSDLDMYIAKKVHKGLETFKVPAAVAKKCGKKKIERVFRDQEELPIGSDLNDNISGALATSEWLLVICSPRTPESYWVKKEITSFIELHDREHVLAILIEGEPNESFPPELLTDENGNPVEPLAADVRGKNKSEINKKFKTEILRLAAPVLGCSYDDLRQRHKERRMKKAMTIVACAAAIIAGLGIGFGIYNAGMVREIQANYAEKQVNQSKYLAETSENLLLNGDRRAATLVALEALPTEENERPYVGEAENALTEALSVYDTGNNVSPFRLLTHDVNVSKMYFSDDGNYLTTILSDESYGVWRVDEGKQVYYHPGFYDENNKIVDSEYANVLDEKFYLVTGYELYVYSFDDEELFYEEYEKRVGEAAICAQTSQLAVFSGNLKIYDGKTMSKVKEINLPDEFTSVSKMAYSVNGKYVAVDNFDVGSDNVKVAVVEVETGKVNTYSLSEQICSKLILDDNGTLFGLSYTSSVFSASIDNVSVSVDKIKWGAKEADWRFNREIDNSVFYNASLCMTAVYDSEQNLDPLISIATTVYSINGKTGEEIAHSATSSQIRSFLANAVSRIGFVAEENGTIDFYSVDTGTFYTNNAIKTNSEISELLLKNSHLVMRANWSPSVKVYTYQSGDGIEEAYTAEANIESALPSEDESAYAVRMSSNGTDYSYCFFKSEDDSVIGSMNIEDGYINKECFIGNIFYAFNSFGDIYVFDTESKESKKYSFDEISSSYYTNLSENKKYALMSSALATVVVDVENGVIVRDLTDLHMFCGVVTNDGKSVYYSDSDGLFKYNLETGLIEKDTFENADMSKSNGNIEKCIVLDEKNNRIAVACLDGLLRIYDLDSCELLREIYYNSFRRCYLYFSEDGKYLFLQGDDYILRIYDVENDEFAFVAEDQINEITSIRETPDGSEAVINNSVEMYTMNMNDLSIKNRVTGGEQYLKNYSKVYVSNYKTLYKFHAASLEELIKRAQTIYADEPLTDLEKLKYNVE